MVDDFRGIFRDAELGGDLLVGQFAVQPQDQHLAVLGRHFPNGAAHLGHIAFVDQAIARLIVQRGLRFGDVQVDEIGFLPYLSQVLEKGILGDGAEPCGNFARPVLFFFE